MIIFAILISIISLIISIYSLIKNKNKIIEEEDIYEIESKKKFMTLSDIKKCKK